MHDADEDKRLGDKRLIASALSGDRPAAAMLVKRLMPVIQFRVARVLLRRRPPGRSIRTELEDLVQDVLSTLLADGGRVLRQWEPERGLGLESFVGLVAERHAGAVMRSARRSPFTEEPVPEPVLDRSATPSVDADTRELLARTLHLLEARLSPLGVRLFELLFGAELDTGAICRELGLTPNAVYVWKHRIIEKALEIRAELEAPARGAREVTRGDER